MHAPSLLVLAATAAPALADTHALFAGFLESGDTIVGLEFDDVTNELTLTKNISAPGSSGQAWITLDPPKKNLYVLASDAFQSYAITEDLDLTYQNNITYPATCIDPFSGFLEPSTVAPYTVWGVMWGTNCSGLGMSVDETGTLHEVVTEATYNSTISMVHGTGLNADNSLLYTADLGANGVWVHAYDAAAGTTTAVQFLAAAAAGAEPRHLVVHPNQRWVYVLLQGTSQVSVLSRDTTTGLLTDTNLTYSIIPDAFTNATSYSGDEVVVSSKNTTSPKYLYASTRGASSTSSPGYVAGWYLDPTTGAITGTAFRAPTTGTGGGANAVVPAGFSEDYFSISDANADFVEVWRVTSTTPAPGERSSANGSSSSHTSQAVAVPVGHVDLDNGPANAVWYS